MYITTKFNVSHQWTSISVAFIHTFALRQHACIQPHRPQKQIRIINLALRNLGRQPLRRNNIIQNPLPNTRSTPPKHGTGGNVPTLLNQNMLLLHIRPNSNTRQELPHINIIPPRLRRRKNPTPMSLHLREKLVKRGPPFRLFRLGHHLPIKYNLRPRQQERQERESNLCLGDVRDVVTVEEDAHETD